jgi:hypothetical protein
MMRNAVLALALLGGASAQDAQMVVCQSDLVSMSDQFNAACCADPSNCANGAPVQCDAGCAAIWNPFCADRLPQRARPAAVPLSLLSFRAACPSQMHSARTSSTRHSPTCALLRTGANELRRHRRQARHLARLTKAPTSMWTSPSLRRCVPRPCTHAGPQHVPIAPRNG